MSVDRLVVVCGGLPARKIRGAEMLRLDVSKDAPADHRVEIKIEKVLRGLVDDPPDAIIDLLEIAAYLYIADRLTKREGPTMAGMGARWRRRFEFRIPVRCPDLWGGSDVNAALVDVLSFLSEDAFSFVFEPMDDTMRRQPHLTFDEPAARKFTADSVLMFSGGLDSLAGAVEEAIQNRKSVVLVAHQSATAIAHRQNTLAHALQRAAPPNTMLYLPIWVRKGDQEPVEHTQRLRSFLFAALGTTIARLFNQDRLLFFENGITSFNLPVADHVIGTRASRTTHPRTLKSMAHLATLLLDRPFAIDNPFLWLTKAQVVRKLARHGHDQLIPMTTSCAQIRQLSFDGRQCGLCSQCVERRFALLAASMEDVEPSGTYSVDLFEGPYETNHKAAMAAHHVLRAHQFASMSETAFVASHGEIFRAISSLPGRSAENIQRIYDLHRGYGREVVTVVNQRLRAAGNLEAVLNTRPTSLLPILSAAWSERGTIIDHTETEEPISARPEVRKSELISARTVIIALDEQKKEVLIEGGKAIGGKCFLLVSRLARQYRADTEKKIDPDDFKFTRSESLFEPLGATDAAALRQQILRARRAIATAFRRSSGYDLDQEDVVQSRPWSGYRLNPFVILVDPKQIRGPGSSEASRLSGPLVTTPAADRGKG